MSQQPSLVASTPVMDTCSHKYSEGGRSSEAELNNDTTSTEQIARYKSARADLSTENTTSVTAKKTYYWSTAEHLELRPEYPSRREQKYYGSPPEHLWSELQPKDPGRCVETVNGRKRSDGMSKYVKRMDPLELEIGEEIAQRAQSCVFLAKYTCRPWAPFPQEDVVVKKYKTRGVDGAQLWR